VARAQGQGPVDAVARAQGEGPGHRRLRAQPWASRVHGRGRRRAERAPARARRRCRVCRAQGLSGAGFVGRGRPGLCAAARAARVAGTLRRVGGDTLGTAPARPGLCPEPLAESGQGPQGMGASGRAGGGKGPGGRPACPACALEGGGGRARPRADGGARGPAPPAWGPSRRGAAGRGRGPVTGGGSARSGGRSRLVVMQWLWASKGQRVGGGVVYSPASWGGRQGFVWGRRAGPAAGWGRARVGGRPCQGGVACGE
jgi:hypothetical protein